MTLNGCSSLNFLSGSNYTALKLLQAQFFDSGTGINRELIDSIPYASSIISFGNQTESLIILESKQGNKNQWVSADNVRFLEKNGRIHRTIGLPGDLHSIDRPKLEFEDLVEKENFVYSAYYSFRNPELNNLKVEISSKVIGVDTQEILGKKMTLILLEESMYSPLINWKAKNRFWIDPINFFVWKSRQYISPKLPYIDFEVTKKPAG